MIPLPIYKLGAAIYIYIYSSLSYDIYMMAYTATRDDIPSDYLHAEVLTQISIL